MNNAHANPTQAAHENDDRFDTGVVDRKGARIEGLPAQYDNIDERGQVSYLDAERRARKERPDKPFYTNHPKGFGMKNFLVTHLSARDWNWSFILVLFRKLVAWSAFMREPESRKSRLYQRAMYFSPEKTTYSAGSIYNLAVDAETQAPGTRTYRDAMRTVHDVEADAEQAAAAQAAINAAEQADTLSAALTRHVRAEEAGEGATNVRENADAAGAAAAGAAGTGCAGEGCAGTIELNQVLYENASKVTVPMDLVKKAIMEAKYIGGMKECLCRAGNDCHDYPHDLACLFLNQAGKVVVKHGMAVELTKEEALARVDRAAELGLTCQSLWVEVEQLIWGFRNDEMDSFMEICFCCPCCCVALNISNNAPRSVKRRFSPLGWTATVDHDRCIGCGKCLSVYCPQDAIHFRESDGKMVVDQENCVGCGICRAHCPENAISIRQTMPMRKKVHDYFMEEARIEIVPGPDFSD